MSPGIGSVDRVEGAMRVLVVDDQRINRLVLVDMLSTVGIDAVEVEDAIKALDLLTREPFDLILMDIRMPHMDGYEAVQRIRQMHGEIASVPIVMVTGDVTYDCGRRAAAAGANRLLHKPVSMTELLQAVRELASDPGGQLPDWNVA
jgi:CheY-like chemotaxis protein